MRLGPGRLLVALVMIAGCLASAGTRPASAGPPYVTDDPEPTDYRHWEIYTGFTYDNDGRGSVATTLPFAEFNYGAMPNVQVSISTELNDADFGTAHREGYGITDFAIKTRFVQESANRPQISFYPSIQVPPAGGHAVTLLPLWLQKSSGPWTAFGGGGVYLNRGPGARDYSFVGAALERAISPGMTIGAELYHQGADTLTDSDTTAANVGMIAQIGSYHAILFSIGRGLHGDNSLSGYTSYEFELGPHDARER